MADRATDESKGGAAERPGSERFRTLPPIIRIEDTIAVQEVIPPNDPTMGRDPERDFMLRNAGG